MPSPTSSSLSTLVGISGNNVIDSLLLGIGNVVGAKWLLHNITYSFATSTSVWSTNPSTGYVLPTMNDPFVGYDVLNASDQFYATQALTTWANVANITFTNVADNSSIVGDIRFAYSSRIAMAQAWAYTPSNTAYAGDIWLNSGGSNYTYEWVSGGYEYLTVIHEIGHALGLNHPFEGVTLPIDQDYIWNTVMSYSAQPGHSDWLLSYEPTTPMWMDIMAIQYMYGANNTYHAGNDTYTFSQGVNYFETVWDAGGVDSIVYNATTKGGLIDLRPGAWSQLGNGIEIYDATITLIRTELNTVNIYNTVTIENAYGSSFDDVIYGNDVSNIIDGRLGIDTMLGGMGDDIYYVDNVQDSVVEILKFDIQLASANLNGIVGNSLSQSATISGDGKFISFISVSSNLDSTQGSLFGWQTFVKNMDTGQVALVSTNQLNEQANNIVSAASISANGRYVVFVTIASNLVLGDNNIFSDVYKKDLQTGQIQIVSTDSNGNAATSNVWAAGSSNLPSVSADGRYVLFSSDANNFVANDTNNGYDIFIKDTQTGNIQKLTSATVAATYACISEDGQYAALIGSSSSDTFQVYVKNIVTGELQVNSLQGLTLGGYLQDSRYVSISANGRYVVFQTADSGIVSGDTLSNQDVFLSDMQTGEVKLVSSVNGITSSGVSNVFHNAISADGRFVVFSSDSGSLVANDTNVYADVFVKDMLTGNIQRISVNADGSQLDAPSIDASISNDGRYITFNGFSDSIIVADNNQAVDVFRVSNPFLQNGEASGIDTINSSVSYTLPTYVENLNLSFAFEINGTGNQFNNILVGNDAANSLDGLGGADTMRGGDGNDIYYVDNIGDVLIETNAEAFTGGIDTVFTDFTYTLGINLEQLQLTGALAINANGNTQNNFIGGNVAANVLNGFAGADTMAGGDGNDIYYIDNIGDVIIENNAVTATGGSDIVRSEISYTLGTNLEQIKLLGFTAINGTGNTLNNILTGNAAANILNGLTGADTMIGGDGNDIYYVDNIGDIISETNAVSATGGNDIIRSDISYTLGANLEQLKLIGVNAINGTGNTLNNTLTGNAANNILTGAAGTDTMTGGLGADTFDFNAILDSLTGVSRDVITDFSSAQLDKIDLSGIDAISSTGADDVFSYVGAGPFTNVAGQLRFAAGIVYGDVNGDSVSDFQIQLTGVPILTSDNLVL